MLPIGIGVDLFRLFLVLGLMTGCPETPPEMFALVGAGDTGVPGATGDAKDLSAEGSVLLDMEQLEVQQTQEDIVASGIDTFSVSGELFGTCTGGQLRIDVIEIDAHRSMRIELGVAPTSTGGLFGPITAVYPEAAGPFSAKVPTGKSVQIAAICDVDKDNKIIQGTDKLTPVIALGLLEEDKSGLVLAFPGERPRRGPTGDDVHKPGDVLPGDAPPPNPSGTQTPPIEHDSNADH
jgi:hypothetical protein